MANTRISCGGIFICLVLALSSDFAYGRATQEVEPGLISDPTGAAGKVVRGPGWLNGYGQNFRPNVFTRTTLANPNVDVDSETGFEAGTRPTGVTGNNRKRQLVVIPSSYFLDSDQPGGYLSLLGNAGSPGIHVPPVSSFPASVPSVPSSFPVSAPSAPTYSFPVNGYGSNYANQYWYIPISDDAINYQPTRIPLLYLYPSYLPYHQHQYPYQYQQQVLQQEQKQQQPF